MSRMNLKPSARSGQRPQRKASDQEMEGKANQRRSQDCGSSVLGFSLAISGGYALATAFPQTGVLTGCATLPA
jgi:hypothetical protein